MTLIYSHKAIYVTMYFHSYEDLDEYEELVPPRPNQKPLRSPAPVPSNRKYPSGNGQTFPYPLTPASCPPATPTQGPPTPIGSSQQGSATSGPMMHQYVGQVSL